MTQKPTLITPQTPSGVMELLPRQQIAFQRYMATIRHVYEKFGFLPVETSVFERTEILLTKEGGDTEKQIYFALSTGALKNEATPDMALRFDLTVPLARYVAQHEHELSFPFRRYQMQKSYRGERPQRGRKRELYQFDIDVIGKDTLSIAYDAELPAIVAGIFRDLGIGRFQIRVNNRRLLKGLLETYGITAEERQTAALIIIDRMDKVGFDAVVEQLQGEETGLSSETATTLVSLLNADRTNVETLDLLEKIDNKSPLLVEGIAELRQVYEGARALGVQEEEICLHLCTVRGLNYYTGTVYETYLLDDISLGSICSGGRYENLAGHYTKSKLPGVGISIGGTRLFEAMLDRGLVDIDSAVNTDALVLQVEPDLVPEYFRLAAELRAAGLSVETYLEPHKLAKQFKYADRSAVPVALVMGGDELARKVVTVKHMKTGQQEEVPREDIAAHLLGMRAT